MALPDDVELESVDGGDIVLVEKKVAQALWPVQGGTDRSVRPTGGVDIPRRLLVRVLQADESETGPVGIKRVRLEQYEGGISFGKSAQRLVITAQAEGVRFKVLLSG